MRNVIVIMQGTSWFRAVAVDEDAARRWVQDEVDGKHGSGHGYAKGQTAEWWIRYGAFKLVPTVVHD